ncbi:MAG: alpha/beta fold hydrolase [Vicinamibacterales bacterium]
MSAALHVTFIPGAAGRGSFWEPVAGALPSSWTTTLVDLPGLGTTPAIDGVASYDDLATHVAAGMNGPGVVVAQSMGTYVALQLAWRRPDLVTHLVLVAATGGANMQELGAADWRDGYAREYPDAAPWATEPVGDLSAAMTLMAMPVLLIWPTRDPLSPLAVAQHLRSRFMNATLRTIESDDHWVARTHAADVAAAIARFVRPEGN